MLLILPHQDFLESYSANEFRMFCLLTNYRSGGRRRTSASKLKLFVPADFKCCVIFPAIDYSDGSMLEARSSLGSISSFMHDAQAYMKGQLQCSTVQEAFLWERYQRTDRRLCSLHNHLTNWDSWCPPPPPKVGRS